jgi:hypothetical protein
MLDDRKRDDRRRGDVQFFTQLTFEAACNALAGLDFAAWEFPVSAESIGLAAAADQDLPIAPNNSQCHVQAIAEHAIFAPKRRSLSPADAALKQTIRSEITLPKMDCEVPKNGFNSIVVK